MTQDIKKWTIPTLKLINQCFGKKEKRSLKKKNDLLDAAINGNKIEPNLPEDHSSSSCEEESDDDDEYSELHEQPVSSCFPHSISERISYEIAENSFNIIVP